MINDLIKIVYENTINDIIKDIEPNYVEQLKKDYYITLMKNYKDIEIEDNMFKEAVNGEIIFNRDFYGKMSPDLRLSYFIKDSAFDEIKRIFLTSRELVYKKFYNEDIFKKISLDQIQEIIDTNLPKVKEFNKLSAIKCGKDAILNYKYVLGLSDLFSSSVGIRK